MYVRLFDVHVDVRLTLRTFFSCLRSDTDAEWVPNGASIHMCLVTLPCAISEFVSDSACAGFIKPQLSTWRVHEYEKFNSHSLSQTQLRHITP
jgi:hypothetical protein